MATLRITEFTSAEFLNTPELVAEYVRQTNEEITRLEQEVADQRAFKGEARRAAAEAEAAALGIALRCDKLEQHLRELAAGVRSKRALLASGSPSAKYINVIDLLESIAAEAEQALTKGIE